MKRFILAAALFVALVSLPACVAVPEPVPEVAQEVAPGPQHVAHAFCNTEDVDFMKKFTKALVEGGRNAYDLLMRGPTPCYDIRWHSKVQPVPVTILEKMWVFTMPEGEVLEMWKIQDASGKIGFSWITVEGQET